MCLLKTSDGTPKPATWPMWRGPLASGQATAVRTWRLMLLRLVSGAIRFRCHDGGVHLSLRYAGLLRHRRDRVLPGQAGLLPDPDLPHELVAGQLDLRL